MHDRTIETPSAAVIRKAAHWLAELDGDAVTAAQRDACEAWCAEHASHRLAFDRMCGFDARFQRLDGVERAALTRAAHGRERGATRRIAGGLLGLGAIALAGWLGFTSFAGRQLFPDYRTAPGEQRIVTMADGSGLVVDTDSAIDVDENGVSRHVRLFRGRVMANVVADPSRPFQVETRDGTATALGTAFAVERNGERTVVTVVESRVRVCPAAATSSDTDCLKLHPGQRAVIADGRVVRIGSVAPEQAAVWSRGWLEADDKPLAEILTQLNRYRTRPIRFDAAGLSHIRVTGSYPLTDAPRALDAIAETAGITVSRTASGDVTVRAR